MKTLEKKNAAPQTPETQFAEAFARLVTATETIAGCLELMCVDKKLLDKDKVLYDLNNAEVEGGENVPD
jgi:hypothetical protein